PVAPTAAIVVAMAAIVVATVAIVVGIAIVVAMAAIVVGMAAIVVAIAARVATVAALAHPRTAPSPASMSVGAPPSNPPLLACPHSALQGANNNPNASGRRQLGTVGRGPREALPQGVNGVPAEACYSSTHAALRFSYPPSFCRSTAQRRRRG